MFCTECNEKPVLAKGLCGACYHRLRKTGSVQRTNMRNTGLCSVEGCLNQSFAKGLCPHHYEKAQHPLKTIWKIIRSRNPGGFPEPWAAFEAFLADVGARPSPKHQLRRHNSDVAYSKDNVFWLAPVGYNADAMPHSPVAGYAREWHLMRKFKITGEQYAALLNAQGGGCGACGGKETHVYPSGKLKDLSVDHDHDTGEVRGLLCFNCNQGIGRFKNDPNVLRAAADYLERHHNKIFLCETVTP